LKPLNKQVPKLATNLDNDVFCSSLTIEGTKGVLHPRTKASPTLTAANLAAHQRAMAASSSRTTSQGGWVCGGEMNHRRDPPEREEWNKLVKKDPVAADIEKLVRAAGNSKENDAFKADALIEFQNIDDLINAGFPIPKLLEAEEAKIPHVRYPTIRASSAVEPSSSCHGPHPKCGTLEGSFEITDFVPSSAGSQLPPAELAPGEPFARIRRTWEPFEQNPISGMDLDFEDLLGLSCPPLGVPPGTSIPIMAEVSERYDLGNKDVPGQEEFHLYDDDIHMLALACEDCRENNNRCEPGAGSCLQCEEAMRPYRG
jgi:hypothetical protein